MKIVFVMLAFALAVPQAFAAPSLDEAEIERQIKEARRQIDQAAETLKELSIQKYMREGGGKRAKLGVLLGANRARDGVIIDGVTPQSGAAEAGLRGGDKIIGIGGVDLTAEDDPHHALSKFMRTVTPGESVPMALVRDDEPFDTTVLTKAEIELKNAKRAMLGILVGSETSDGLVIAGVTPGGGASEAGLKAGDEITVIGDITLGDERSPDRALSGYMRRVSPGDTVTLVIDRDGEDQTVAVVTQAEGAHVKEFFDKDYFDFHFGGVKPNVHVKHVMHSDQLLAVDGDLAQYFDVDAGVIVVKPPADSQIKAGDVLLRVGEVDVKDLEQAMELLGELDAETEVRVKRRGRERDVTVKADDFANFTNIQKIEIHAPKAPDAEAVVEFKD